MKHLPLNTIQFEKLYSDFFRNIRVRGYSRGKNTSYPSNVREFLFFLENRGIDDIQKVDTQDILGYYEYIKERPNQRRGGCLSDSMVNGHLFSLRLFYDFLMDSKIIGASPLYLPKKRGTKQKDRESLTENEIKEVYFACKTKRERALISIAYGCGLRRSEINALNLNDVVFSNGTVTVRDGKFNKSRIVPMSDGVVRDLKDYIIYERPTLVSVKTNAHINAFFLNYAGTRAAGDYLNTLVKEIISRTKNPVIVRKDITLHCLRHSIATHLRENGAPPEFIQEFLGHSAVDTTTIYMKKNKERMKIQRALL